MGSGGSGDVVAAAAVGGAAVGVQVAVGIQVAVGVQVAVGNLVLVGKEVAVAVSVAAGRGVSEALAGTVVSASRPTRAARLPFPMPAAISSSGRTSASSSTTMQPSKSSIPTQPIPSGPAAGLVIVERLCVMLIGRIACAWGMVKFATGILICL